LKYLLLGLIQGLTEFLPVSSSGHLVVFENLFKVRFPGITFEVFLHLATLIAVVIYLWRDIVEIFDFKKYSLRDQPLVLIAVGTIPAGLVGFLGGDLFERLFESIRWVRYFFVINGFILLSTRWAKGTRENITIRDAILIGIAQSFAILPGISRSGATITAGLLLGIQPSKAFSFSFLLSIVAISGAAVLKAKELSGVALSYGYMAGFLAALVSGLLAIMVLKKVVLVRKLHYFAYYTLLLGVLLFFI